MGEVVDGWILREEAVPEDAPAGYRHGAEHLRDGGRREEALDAELLALEDLEVTTEDLHRTDLQGGRTWPAGKLPQLGKIKVPVEVLAEPLGRQRGEMVGADLGKHHHVPQRLHLHDNLVEDAVPGGARGGRP